MGAVRRCDKCGRVSSTVDSTTWHCSLCREAYKRRGYLKEIHLDGTDNPRDFPEMGSDGDDTGDD